MCIRPRKESKDDEAAKGSEGEYQSSKSGMIEEEDLD